MNSNLLQQWTFLELALDVVLVLKSERFMLQEDIQLILKWLIHVNTMTSSLTNGSNFQICQNRCILALSLNSRILMNQRHFIASEDFNTLMMSWSSFELFLNSISKLGKFSTLLSLNKSLNMAYSNSQRMKSYYSEDGKEQSLTRFTSLFLRKLKLRSLSKHFKSQTNSLQMESLRSKMRSSYSLVISTFMNMTRLQTQWELFL